MERPREGVYEITYDCDVLVIGGGVSGYCAATQAARDGCKVILLEKDTVLGGNSGPNVGVGPRGAHWYNDFGLETGLIHSIDEEIGWVHGRTPCSAHSWFSISRRGEAVVQQYLEQAGVRILKMHYAKSPIMEGNRIKAVIVEDLAAYRTVLINIRHVVIEGSGDGHIGAVAGADFDMGVESRDEFQERSSPPVRMNDIQGSSVMGLAYRADTERVFVPPPGTPPYEPRTWEKRVSVYVRTAGWRNFGEGKRLMFVYVTEAGGDRDTIREDAAIYEELLRQMWSFWNYIKNGPNKESAKNWDLIWISTKSGKRESRRFKGDYVLTQTDIEEGRLFPDDIAYGGHALDEHQQLGKAGNIQLLSIPPMYGIPYRCCYSRNIGNLLLAGRLISCTHIGHSSPRVMRTGGAIGQALGIAAAICCEQKITPREVYQHHLKNLQDRLLLADGTILGRPVPREGDLARKARVTVTSELRFNQQEPGMQLPLYLPLGNVLWDWPKILRKVWVYLENKSDRPQKTSLSVHRAKREPHWISSDDMEVHKRNDLRDAAFRLVAQQSVTIPPRHHGWFEILFRKPVALGERLACCDDDRIIISLDPNQHLHWALVERKRETGDNSMPFSLETDLHSAPAQPKLELAVVVEHRPETAAWFAFGEMATMRLDPAPMLGEGRNVIDGFHRRFSRGPTHMWMADPAQPLPQDLTLTWSKPQRMSEVALTFDNLDRTPHELPWECGERVSKILVKSYELWIQEKRKWRRAVFEETNYHRFRVHLVKSTSATGLRLRVMACHGHDRSARVYAVRVR
jgi:FAD-dependent oxidoreductase family protein